MKISHDRLRGFARRMLIGANLLVLIGLIGTAVFVRMESRWATPVFRSAAADAFAHGTIGTELMPLPVALVLPDIFPDQFLPGGPQAGDWIEQFGFLRNPDPNAKDGLPIGFVTSNYRPQSGAPSPVPFVGFSCALCHTTHLHESEDQPGAILYGPGSISLNLFSWIDAFQAAILAREPLPAGREPDPAHPAPYRLTTALVAEKYQAKTGRKLGLLERGMITVWLRQLRTRLNAGLPRFDDPFGNGRSRDPELVPTGPTRTQPFRTLIRTVLNRPGDDMAVYTKIATVYSEDMRHRAQFDGTIANLYARSSLAALAAGATVANMSLPEIAHNIRKASDFTSTLRPPRYADLFPAHAPRSDAVQRGWEVYKSSCYGCHGGRDPASGAWSNGPQVGEIAPVSQLKTDPERVMFRHYGELGGLLFALFPAKHPFHFPREEVWPHPGEEENISIRGYVNAPLDGMFLRGPYLHNGSVLTLAELINLKKRRDVFYRGDNTYDPVDVGYRSPEAPTRTAYFRFDTSIRGNSNRGHDYPWTYEESGHHAAELTDLLEYLKTL